MNHGQGDALMSRWRIKPTYRFHKKTGKAIVTYYDGEQRKSTLLPGKFNSAESQREYKRLLAILDKGGLPVAKPEIAKQPTRSIAEVMVEYVTRHVDTHYGDSERLVIRQALRPLKRLFADLPANEFTPLCLLTVPDAMTSGSWKSDEEQAKDANQKRPPGMARTTTNKHISRVKAFFGWAVTYAGVPANVHAGLLAVKGLRPGHPEVRETEPVKPVDIEVVDQVLPLLPPVVGDMIRLLLLSGARVGELTKCRTADIDRSGSVWLYRVEKHKTAHRGHSRTIAFGPKAKLILARYVNDADPEAVLFSPAAQDILIKEAKRAARKTRVQPSQLDRRKAKPKRKPGAKFDHHAIDHALARACKKQNVPHFHVHQLRHTAALTIMCEHGIEAARRTLGHKTLNMSLFYPSVDVEKAKETMAAIG
jgi:integrase